MHRRILLSTAAAVSNGNAHDQEERRAERRLAQERGRKKKLRRVKSNIMHGKLPWEWKSEPHFQMAFLSFSLFSLVVATLLRVFHHGSVAPRRAIHMAYRPKYKQYTEGEYNSDYVGGSLMSKLRGKRKYVIPESMENIGTKKRWYTDLRREYDTEILPKDDERSLNFVEAKRKSQGTYKQSPKAQTPYDIYNCPDHPPEGYPMQWPVLDVTHNWPPDDPRPPHNREIYQGLCIFDYRTELHKASNYQYEDMPFVVRNDPAVARSAERWNHPGYMERMLMGKEDTMRRTEYSPNNHFMYWVDKRPREERREAARKLKRQQDDGLDVHGGYGRGDQEDMAEAIHEIEEFNELKNQLGDAKEYAWYHQDDDDAQEEVARLKREVDKAKRKQMDAVLEGWQPPTENLRMTYPDWLELANVTDDELGPDNPHWYFRLIGCGNMGEDTADGSCDKGSSEWLFDELPFFQPREDEERSLYLVDPTHQKGIHCRFGMKGVIAENHFDVSRNAIALLGGQRRYILGDPGQCTNMNLLPRGHPSARHSAVDWSNPDLVNFPTFVKTHVNEVVLQPGDVLYLPTNWFHYIISLELNMQCNTRSGGEDIYREYINECGF